METGCITPAGASLFGSFLIPRKDPVSLWDMRHAVYCFNRGDDCWCLWAMDCHLYRPAAEGYIPCTSCIYSTAGNAVAKIEAFSKFARSRGFTITRKWSKNLAAASGAEKLMD